MVAAASRTATIEGQDKGDGTSRLFGKKAWAAALATAVSIVTIGSARVAGEEAKGTFGAYEPNSGFKVANTEKGELSLRIYTYIRYLNQKGLDPSDGNPIFKSNLFGDGIRIDKATYQMFSADGGVKYRGLSLDGECYWRWVNDFRGPGAETLAFDELRDNGLQLQASGMVLPQTLQGYAGWSKVLGEYGDPWDFRLGLNWYPWHNYVVRWNAEYLHTERCPVGGLSLPYVVGGTGDIFYSSFQVNF